MKLKKKKRGSNCIDYRIEEKKNLKILSFYVVTCYGGASEWSLSKKWMRISFFSIFLSFSSSSGEISSGNGLGFQELKCFYSFCLRKYISFKWGGQRGAFSLKLNSDSALLRVFWFASPYFSFCNSNTFL